MSIWDRFPIEGHTVTLDKCHMPRKLMTKEQAIALLAIVADKPKGMLRQEFIDEALKVINGPLEA